MDNKLGVKPNTKESLVDALISDLVCINGHYYLIKFMLICLFTLYTRMKLIPFLSLMFNFHERLPS